MATNKKKIKCKFCGEAVNEEKIIYGMTSSINICDKCVDLCNSILAGRKLNKKMTDIAFNPQEIKKRLDEYVVGQDRAKKALSVAVYNHYKRIFKQNISNKDDVEIQKSNAIVLGPSGCGKSHLIRTIAKIIDVPIIIQDASNITAPGYVGDSVSDILERLLDAADGSKELAERSIICLDEIDKLKSSGDGGKDVNGTSAQSSVLKLLEGGTFEVGGSPLGKGTTIDTTNILFICMGAFSGLEDIIASRLSKKKIGFGGENLKVKAEDSLLSQVKLEDIENFGLIKELLGRLQVIVTLDPLDENALCNVLTEPKDSFIKQYKQLMKYDDIDLEFNDEAIKKVAKLAISQKTGARSLKSILEQSLMNIMYKLPGSKTKKYMVTEKDIIERT